MKFTGFIKTLVVSGIVAGSVATFASTAGAWPAPQVTGDCKSWTVREIAPDNDWQGTAYWMADGDTAHHARSEPAVIQDTTSATTREFIARWFSADGTQLDSRPQTGTRDLSGCTPKEEFHFTVEPDCKSVFVKNLRYYIDDDVYVTWSNGTVEYHGVGPDGYRFVAPEGATGGVVTDPAGTFSFKLKTCQPDPVVTGSYVCKTHSTNPAETIGLGTWSVQNIGLAGSWEVIIEGRVIGNAETDSSPYDFKPALAVGNHTWTATVGGKPAGSGTFVVTDDCLDRVAQPSMSASQPTCTVLSGTLHLANAAEATADANFDVSGTSHVLKPGESKDLVFAAGTSVLVKSPGLQDLAVTFVAASGCTQPSAAVTGSSSLDCAGNQAPWNVSVSGVAWPEGATLTVKDADGNVLKSGLKPGDTFQSTVAPATWVLNGRGGEVSGNVTLTNSSGTCTKTEIQASASNVDRCGVAKDTYTLSALSGGWTVNGEPVLPGTYAGRGTVVVVASADATHTLTGQTSWTYVFTNNACEPSTL